MSTEEQDYLTLEEDFESNETLTTYTKKYFATRESLVKHLGWNQDGDKRYVDSGNWTDGYKNDAGNAVYSVDRGCACMHDCCGHVCTERYEVIEADYYWLVITQIGLNY